ncbi:MAG: GHKL domain-containing protein [Clostridiales bacterium]|nr:GHKL domain-containing protein [Clostridiales bacterium]
MDANGFLMIFLSMLNLIPSGILCIAPMKNHLRYSYRKVMILLFLLFLTIIPVGALLIYLFRVNPNVILLPIMAICFTAYCKVVTANIAQSTAIFVYVCAIMSVFSNFANAIDAGFDPQGGASYITPVYVISCISISVAGALILYPLLGKYARFLVDNMSDSYSWWITSVISFMFMSVNISMIPQKYETLYVNNIFRTFILIQSVVFFLLIFLGAIFYNMVKSLLAYARLRIKTDLMEMQEIVYEKQHKYMDDNARIRHDFKHTLRTIRVMAEKGDLDELNRYLDEYANALPENEIKNYSRNIALNAVLNYYNTEAASNGIETSYRIDLPEGLKTGLIDYELCSITGNILDNAIRAASEQTEGRKFIELAIHIENNKDLYIVGMNSFGGKALHKGDSYISTKKKQSGIGLRSIATIAEHHGGSARFHHEGTIFYSDILIPVDQVSEV